MLLWQNTQKNLIRSFFQVEMKPKKKAPRKFFRKAKIYCTLRVNSSTSPPLLKFAVAQCIHKWLFFCHFGYFQYVWPWPGHLQDFAKMFENT
jgi:hypothetical protein